MYEGSEKSDIFFECNTCGKTFNKYCSLRLHRKWKHDTEPANRTCIKCDKMFNDPHALKRHVLAIHDGNPDADPRPHASIIWNDHEDLQTFKFQNYKDFCDWKAKTEREAVAKYVRQRGSRRRKDGSTVTVFNCHRDGYFHSKGKLIRRNRLACTSKINSHCPSHMRVTQKNNTFTVAYLPTHSGHSVDLAKLSVSRKDDDRVARLLEKDAPLDDILDKIKNLIMGLKSNSKKGLPNVISKYVVPEEATSDNSPSSLDQWVSKCQDECSAVLLYKPKGVFMDVYPQLMVDDVCLILANKQQLDSLKKFGNKYIFVDAISTTFDNLFLYPIVVTDDSNKGILCSYMLSNLKTSTIIDLYFQTIQSNLNFSLQPQYLISGTNESMFNSWLSVNPKSQTTMLFSTWKIDQEWRNMLKLINKKQKQVEVYRLIKMLEFVDNVYSFNAVANHLKSELTKNEETAKFALRFMKYLGNPEPWAFCHRSEVETNFGSGLENIHSVLKSISTNRHLIKTLKNFILTLLRFGCLKYYDTFLSMDSDELENKIAEIKSSHDDSVSMGSVYLEEVSKVCWSVQATLSNDQSPYYVTKTKDTCDCHCECPECSVCMHIFICTCLDFGVNWKMCKHIHLVSCWIKCKVVEVNSKPASIKLKEEQVTFEIEPLEDFQHVMGEEIEISASLDDVKEEVMEQEVFILEEEPSEIVCKDDVDNDVDSSVQYALVVQESEDNSKDNFEVADRPEPSVQDCFKEKKKELLLTMTNMIELIESEEQLEAVSKHISVLDEILRTSGSTQPIHDNSNVLNDSFFTNQDVQTVILTPEQESLLENEMEVPIEFIKYQVVQLKQ